MKRADPYSTPARRRRIINDVAKSVLRQYCIAACNNVIRFRKETKASIIIQCCVRQFLARRTLSRLIFIKKTKAAVKIQAIWRMKLAKLLKIRLHKELRLRQAIRLALCVQTLYRNRKERLHRIALMVARRLALQKKRNHAATTIQRVFRGFLGRRRVARLIALRQALHQRRRNAAIKMQAQMRRCLAVQRVSVIRTRERIRFITLRLKLGRWRKHFRKHRLSVVVCQSVIRMFLAKRRVSAYRLLLAQMRLDKMSELRPLSPYQIPLRRDPVPTKTMNIQVDLTPNLMTELAATGPRCVMAWCLDNFILHYHAKEGYTLGAVVQQVVHSVDSLLGTSATDAEAAGAGSVEGTSAEDRVITLARWDEGQASDVPETKYLPEGWSKACSGVEGSAVVSVHLFSGRMEIHVRVDNPCPAPPAAPPANTVEYSLEDKHRLVFDFRCRIDVPPVVTSSLIVIVLNQQQVTEESTVPYADLLQFKRVGLNEFKSLARGTSNEVGPSSTSAKLKDIEEAKFRFKNALVQVITAPPAEPTPPPTPPPTDIPLEAAEDKEEVIVFDDELSDDSLIEEAPPPPIKESVRPQTATVVRIVLREPTPPPPDLDYMARRIQFMMRRRMDLLNVAAEYIQSMFYHHHMMYRWQSLVRQVLARAVRAVETLQRMVRCHQARIKLCDLRREYRYCPDFSLDEEVNWASFGMLTYGPDARGVSSTVAAPAPLVARSVTGSSTVSGKLQFGSTGGAFFNPVGALLDLIQLPPPPPGCVLSCDPMVLLPPRVADNDYGSSVSPTEKGPMASFSHIRSINAEVRHCVLRAAMPPRSLNISGIVEKDALDSQSLINEFVTGEASVSAAGKNVSFVDKAGAVHCCSNSLGFNDLLDSRLERSDVKVLTSPYYSAIAEKYR